MKPQLLAGTTWHKRMGKLSNAFRYKVDYVLLEPEQETRLPYLFSRNRGNVVSLHDRDHGGARHNGRGAAWARDILSLEGASDAGKWRLLLLAQPRVLGGKFTPVSFWFALDDEGQLRAAIAEVNNTFGDRHSYLCSHKYFAPILPDDVLEAQKIFHVSPFQPVEGLYQFRFNISPKAVLIDINLRHVSGGLTAGLGGKIKPLTSMAILRVLVRRPFGSLRVLALIYYQALKLWFKGATFHTRPLPPVDEVSR